MKNYMEQETKSLYREQFEHDNCGIGAVVNSKGIKSHRTVENALKIVENLEHRAGKDAEGKTGDGVGILLQISHKFFQKVCKELGISLGEEREYGIAQFFFPQEELQRNQAKKMFEIIVEKEGLELLDFVRFRCIRRCLGKKQEAVCRTLCRHSSKSRSMWEKGLEFERKLYIARRVFEQSNDNTYVVSMSSRTIVYKGMFLVGQLRTFFADLQDPDYESAIALVHSRFSTNTNPSWERAHPNRFMVHNGEINTIRGNADKMLAREETMESGALKGELHKILPVVDTRGSDSSMLDNTLEFLVMSGMELPLAMMIAIPEPWSKNATLSQDVRDFYQYYATMMEPWDGPASIVFSDGDIMGAVLDRNGLRPSRYYVMKNGDLILGFRSRSSGSSGRRDCIKRTSPSGENAVGRYGKGQDQSGRRTEGNVYDKTALRRMAGQQSGGTQRLENPEYACRRVRSGKEKTTSESIWIHIRRIPQFHPEHGIKRRRIHCGNGCGHAACSAFR